MPQPLTDGSGGYWDTGVAQESKLHQFVESLLHQRDCLPAKTLNGSFAYTVAWYNFLEGSSSPFAPLAQDVNIGVGTVGGSGLGPSNNPVVTGLAPIQYLELWVSPEPNSEYPTLPPDFYGYVWYDAGGGTQDAAFSYTDWQNPGTWTISFTKSTNTTTTYGTVSFYATLSGNDYLLATMDAASGAGAHSNVTFDSTTTFGVAAPFRIKAVMLGMGAHWVGTWQYGYYDASDNLQVLDSGTNNFIPTGINWNNNEDPNLGASLPTNNYITGFNMTNVPGCSFGISGTRTGP